MEDPIPSRDAARRVPLSRKSSVILNRYYDLLPNVERSEAKRLK